MAFSLANLSNTQKLIGAAAGGLGLLLFLGRKGGDPTADGGIAVVDVRRPTDDMNSLAGNPGSYRNTVNVGEGGRHNVYYDDVFTYGPDSGNVRGDTTIKRPPVAPVVPTRPRPRENPKPPPGPVKRPPVKDPPHGRHNSVVVKVGDTLWGLAGKYYGNPQMYKTIAKANDIKVTVGYQGHPDRPYAHIEPGQKLTLPQIRKK